MKEWDDLATERNFDGALEYLAGMTTIGAVGIVEHVSHATDEEVARWRQRMPTFDPEARRQIVVTLVETSEADVHLDFTGLFEASLDDEDEIVRATAIDGLWECEAPRLISRFIAMTHDDRSARVRASASAALGGFIERAVLDGIADERIAPIVTALVDAFEDEGEDLDVRRRALESLGFSEVPEAVPVIEAGIRSDEIDMRASALLAMGRSVDQRWKNEVIAALDDDEPELRFEAARAAGELCLREATMLLARLAAEDDMEIRLAAIWALGEIGGKAARGILQRLLAETVDEEENYAIDEALAIIALSEGDMDYWAHELREGSAFDDSMDGDLADDDPFDDDLLDDDLSSDDSPDG